MKLYFCEKHSKLDRISIFVEKYSKLDPKFCFLLKSIRNLTDIKETGKFMDADMHEFGKHSFLVEQKIEKLIFVATHKTTRSHL